MGKALLPHKLAEFADAWRRTIGLQNEKGTDTYSQPWIRHRDHRSLLNGRMKTQDILDLFRAEVFATPDDEIFRSEEHTSELQSLMRNSYAVFCLKKKKI